jgi:UDP-glucose 4-epimerase
LNQFKRVLVTGGAGFIGSHVVELLLENQSELEQVLVLDDFSSGDLGNLVERTAKLRIIEGSVNDEDLVREVVKEVDVVIHEAAVVGFERTVSEPGLAFKVNVEGTRTLLRFCSKTGTMKRFVFASSAEVYGNQERQPISEDAIPSPISPEGKSKLEAERACLEFQRMFGLETTILRYFNVYGPRSRMGSEGSVVNKFAERLLRGEAPQIFGKGRHSRDFIHVKDVALATVQAAFHEEAGAEIFNVGSGRSCSMEELADLESRILLGENVIIPLDYKLERAVDIEKSEADISKIRKKLGFALSIPSLEEGLASYLKTLKPSRLEEEEQQQQLQSLERKWKYID